MPTGLKDSPNDSGRPFKGLPQPAINVSFLMVFTADYVPQTVQGYAVPAQATVRVRAHNGQDAGNTKPCRTALYREALTGPQGDILTPDTEIVYPVSNTAQIWGAGKTGDGLIISIRANPTA